MIFFSHFTGHQSSVKICLLKFTPELVYQDFYQSPPAFFFSHLTLKLTITDHNMQDFIVTIGSLTSHFRTSTNLNSLTGHPLKNLFNTTTSIPEHFLSIFFKKKNL